MSTMPAWRLTAPGPVESGPLALGDVKLPEPGAREIRIKVNACGVCRTDLHVVEGDLPVHRDHVVPGHQIVGIVDELGAGSGRFRPGDRVGIAWLRTTCGRCKFCARGDENLCSAARFTGYDEDGGYAGYATVPEEFAYELPDFDDEHCAPLLCAGIIGYRALRLANVPVGGSLGVYGFGGSAHIACQVAVHRGARVHVFTRSEKARRRALELGAVSATVASSSPPEPLDAGILFAPSGALVPVALEHLDRGATLALAGVHLSEIPPLDFDRHLFGERIVTSVTANTRTDGRELLDLAAEIPIRVTTTPFQMARANEALLALKRGAISGSAVLLAD
jgi:propanol-preferring alcohol dehydrogenase